MLGRTVLVVEDDDEIRMALCAYARKAGFRVLEAADGAGALALFRQHAPDLLLLDVMLPQLSGFEVLKVIREQSDVPILLLTARTLEPDVLHGFRLGADDYISKPFRPLEVMARAQAALRRARPEAGASSGTVLHGALGLRLDTQRAAAWLETGGRLCPLDLTPSELELLAGLLLKRGRGVGREVLAARLGTALDTSERAVDSHIKNLRKKRGEGHIETVHGLGYRYVA